MKTKIQEAKGLPADSLKIVFKGKTVANEDTIEKLAIKETDFIVVMTQVQVTFVSCRSRNLSPRKRSSLNQSKWKQRRRKYQNQKRRRKPRSQHSLSLLQPITKQRFKNLCRWVSLAISAKPP